MNTRDAMAALLDGKRIRQDHHDSDVYFALDERGELRNHRGDRIELMGTRAHDRTAGRLSWHLFEEHNPNSPGTFEWAREEAKRGPWTDKWVEFVPRKGFVLLTHGRKPVTHSVGV